MWLLSQSAFAASIFTHRLKVHLKAVIRTNTVPYFCYFKNIANNWKSNALLLLEVVFMHLRLFRNIRITDLQSQCNSRTYIMT